MVNCADGVSVSDWGQKGGRGGQGIKAQGSGSLFVFSHAESAYTRY